MKNKQLKLGIDIGRVIIAPGDDNADTSFLRGSIRDALNTPSYPGAFDAIRLLVSHFESRVWLVSKAGPTTQEKTRLWLEHYGFYQATGVHRENLRFCRKRHEKALHCEELGLTHFIDDRLDVLRHLRFITNHLYLFGDQKPGIIPPAWVNLSPDWNTVLQLIVTNDINGKRQCNSSTKMINS